MGSEDKVKIGSEMTNTVQKQVNMVNQLITQRWRTNGQDFRDAFGWEVSGRGRVRRVQIANANIIHVKTEQAAIKGVMVSHKRIISQNRLGIKV